MAERRTGVRTVRLAPSVPDAPKFFFDSTYLSCDQLLRLIDAVARSQTSQGTLHGNAGVAEADLPDIPRDVEGRQALFERLGDWLFDLLPEPTRHLLTSFESNKNLRLVVDEPEGVEDESLPWEFLRVPTTRADQTPWAALNPSFDIVRHASHSERVPSLFVSGSDPLRILAVGVSPE